MKKAKGVGNRHRHRYTATDRRTEKRQKDINSEADEEAMVEIETDVDKHTNRKINTKVNREIDNDANCNANNWPSYKETVSRSHHHQQIGGNMASNLNFLPLTFKMGKQRREIIRYPKLD